MLNQGHGIKGLNPQQMKFKEAYLNPESPTFGNAMQSALAAGYSEYYATDITTAGTEWFRQIIADFERLQKAEKTLDEALVIDTDSNPNLWKVRADVAKFVAKGMAKEKYSEQKNVDVTTKGEKIETNEQIEALRQEFEQKLRDNLAS